MMMMPSIKKILKYVPKPQSGPCCVVIKYKNTKKWAGGPLYDIQLKDTSNLEAIWFSFYDVCIYYVQYSKYS